MEMNGSALCPRCFTAEEKAPITHWIGGWMDYKSGLHALDKRKILLPLPGIELRLLRCPACSLSRYINWAIQASPTEILISSDGMRCTACNMLSFAVIHCYVVSKLEDESGMQNSKECNFFFFSSYFNQQYTINTYIYFFLTIFVL
jgi:hypothetical protein